MYTTKELCTIAHAIIVSGLSLIPGDEKAGVKSFLTMYQHFTKEKGPLSYDEIDFVVVSYKESSKEWKS